MILNLTPHTINIFDTDGKTQLYEMPSSGIARCKTEKKQIADIKGIAIFDISYGEVEGVPPVNPGSGTGYIVSFLVRQALPERNDLYSPGELIRNEKGQPIGCIGLTK